MRCLRLWKRLRKLDREIVVIDEWASWNWWRQGTGIPWERDYAQRVSRRHRLDAKREEVRRKLKGYRAEF